MTALALLADRVERDRFCDFLCKAEGRDKFGKVLQFFVRFLSGVLRNSGFADWGQRCEFFWRGMLDGRRMQWFGKSLIELRTVQQTLENKSLAPEIRCSHAIARMFFALRWAVENVMILVKLGVLKGSKWQDLNRVAKRFWFGAIVAGVVTEMLKIRKISEQTKDVERAHVEQKKCVQSIACHLADSVAPFAIGFDTSISDTVIGGSHTMAACIQSYNLYPASK